MRAKLQKLIGTAVLGLALSSNSLPAWAGYADLPQVTILSDRARGTMAGARYSTDSQQYIGCSFSNTNSPFVMCSATDRNGQSFFCTGVGSQFAAAAKSISDFSYISFGVAVPGDTACRFLHVENDSENLR